MDVVDAALVVARDQRVEERDAVLVRGLDTAERGGVNDGLVIGVAVSGVVEDAAVDTLRRELESGQGSDWKGARWRDELRPRDEGVEEKVGKGERTVELQLQRSTHASGTGSHVLKSTTWIAKRMLTPDSPSVTSLRISSPRTSTTQTSVLQTDQRIPERE